MRINKLEYVDICKVFEQTLNKNIKPVLFDCEDGSKKWFMPVCKDKIVVILKHNFRQCTAILSDDNIIFNGNLKRLNKNKDFVTKYINSVNHIFSDEYAKEKYLKSVHNIHIDEDLQA